MSHFTCQINEQKPAEQQEAYICSKKPSFISLLYYITKVIDLQIEYDEQLVIKYVTYCWTLVMHVAMNFEWDCEVGLRSNINLENFLTESVEKREKRMHNGPELFGAKPFKSFVNCFFSKLSRRTYVGVSVPGDGYLLFTGYCT